MSVSGEGAASGAGRVIAAAREACPACPLYAVCPLAPIFLQVEARKYDTTTPRLEDRARHPHARTLDLYLHRLRSEFPDAFERELLLAMGGADEGLALIAGCLLAAQHWEEPERLRRLLETINARTTRGAERQLSTLEEQLQRAGAIAQAPGFVSLLRTPFRLRRPEREVTAYEAMRLVARLVAGETPALWWTSAVVDEDRPAFEASFALRDKSGDGGGDESSMGGPGSLDLFFTARAGGRSGVFYYRRDGASGKQALVPAEGVRADSLLRRMFKVFDTDAKKTHRIFAKLARGLNNGYRQLDKKMLWEGLKRLEKEHLGVLALYAPRLARFVEKRAEFPGLYRLVKFLHLNVADDENGIPAHVKIFERRSQAGSILETYGKEPFMHLCRMVFRVAEAYRPGPASADLIYKIGEVAYLLTAVEGFNPRGLEMSLAGRNPLALIAYGLQPQASKPEVLAHRYRRLIETRSRLEAQRGRNGDGDPGDCSALLHAVEQGLGYLAAIHGHADVPALARAVGSAGGPGGGGPGGLGSSGLRPAAPGLPGRRP